MNAAQTIIDQDNATLAQYIQALDDAQDELTSAKLDWQLSNSTGDSLFAADRLDNATANYNRAAAALARWISSAHRSGYRLHRNQESQ